MTVLPDLEGWAIFAAVVEHRSFTAAATALDLSKATVSKAIARLESRLDTMLFHRTSRSLTLTESGRRLAPHAARLLVEAGAAEAAAKEEAQELAGLVRLAAPMTFGILHVAPLIATFMAEHPGVQIELSLADQRIDLTTEGFDAAVRIGNLPDSSLIARRLAELRVSVVAAPSYVARHGEPRRPADFPRHFGLCYTNVDRPGEWRLTGPDGSEESGRPQPRLVTGSGDAMLPALFAGIGIAILPDFILGPALRDNRLVELMPGWRPPQAGIHLVTPPGRHRSARVTALLAFLHAHLGREAGA